MLLNPVNPYDSSLLEYIRIKNFSENFWDWLRLDVFIPLSELASGCTYRGAALGWPRRYNHPQEYIQLGLELGENVAELITKIDLPHQCTVPQKLDRKNLNFRVRYTTGGVLLYAYFIELLSKSMVPLRRVSVKKLWLYGFYPQCTSFLLDTPSAFDTIVQN